MEKFNIYFRKDGRWEGRISRGKDDSGKRKFQYIFGHSREEVEAKIMEIRRQEFLVGDCHITVFQLFEEWFQAIRMKVKESTAANYFMKASKHILPAFGSLKIGELLPKLVYHFIEKKQEKKLSNRYISDIVIILKTMYKYAARVYRIFNPLADIALPRKQDTEIKILDENEQERLKNHIKSNQNPASLGIALSYSTGIRIGELCALQWQDIDLEKRILTVRKTVQRIQVPNGDSKTKIIISEPKSSSSKRMIPIPECTAQMLTRFKGNDSDFLLSGTSKPHEPRTVQRWFSDVLNNADLPSIHFHALRHMFASNCIKLGFDIKTLSEILGHSSVEITLNRYVHSSFEQKQNYMSRINFDF